MYATCRLYDVTLLFLFYSFSNENLIQKRTCTYIPSEMDKQPSDIFKASKQTLPTHVHVPLTQAEKYQMLETYTKSSAQSQERVTASINKM